MIYHADPSHLPATAKHVVGMNLLTNEQVNFWCSQTTYFEAKMERFNPAS
jgi:hypothetical protein